MERAVLVQRLIKTLAFFDIYDQPLTVRELQRLCWDGTHGITQDEIVLALESSPHIAQTEAFYHLVGREDTVRIRQDRVKEKEQKICIAKRGVWWIRWVPFVRLVAVCNTVAFGTADRDSDIDLFIVVKEGGLWLTRLFITVILSLTRYRRHGKCVENRLCLSFYVAESDMNLQSIALLEDPYLVYWVAHLIPMYDAGGVYTRFVHANHQLLSNLGDRAGAYETSPDMAVRQDSISVLVKRMGELIFAAWFGRVGERVTRQMQLQKMSQKQESLRLEPDTRVVVSDTMLKFHETDVREEILQRWKDTYKSYDV